MAGVGGAAPAGVSVAVTQPDALRVVQRSTATGGGQGKGQASISLALAFSGTQPIYCRRRSHQDGVTVLQAPWLANAAAASGSVLMSGIDVPAFDSSGVPVAAGDGWFYLDVATHPTGPWTLGTNRINAGRVVAIAGQSLATRFLQRQAGTDTNATLGVQVSAYCSAHATYNGDTINYMPVVASMPWEIPADGGNYGSTGVSDFLARQCKAFGVATGMIGHTSSGTSSGTYWAGQANATQFQAVAAKAGGAWESQIWLQGHTEAGYATPPNAYKQSLDMVFSALTSANSYAGYAKHLSSIPNIAFGGLWGDPYTRNRIRGAVEAWCAANGANHVCPEDLVLSDGVHPSQAGAITLSQHWHRSTRAELGLRSNAGPSVVSATRTGTTITITLSDVGQGSLVLTGAPHNRIWAFAAGMYDTYGNANNRYPVSALAVVNKTTLSATLANDPGDGSILDLRIYWPNDYSGTPNLDMIRDDLIDADGIAVGRCVKPTFAAISVPAPNPVGAVNPPPVSAANVSPFALTGTATAFGVEEQAGFGQTLSAGTAATSASKGAAFGAGGSTIECFFTCPTVGALQVIFGRGGGQNYLGIAATGKLVTNAVTGATTLVAGKRYHAALVEGPAGTQLYLTNITDSGAGVRDANSTTAVTTKPAACTYYLRHNSSGFAMSGGTLDEVAVWDGAIYSGATYTAPTSPRIGTEADLVALYHLDGDLSEKVAA